MRVAIDIDGPVAELVDKLLALHNLEHGTNVVESDIKSWDIGQYTTEDIYGYFSQEFYDSLDVVSGAVGGVMDLLAAGHEIFFCTAAYVDRRKWIVDNIWNGSTVVVSDNKGLVDADILIDDYHRNIEDFITAKPGRYGILWDKPWNRSSDIDVDFRVMRVKNWNMVLPAIQLCRINCLHPTEISMPRQAKAFREIIDRMYQVHLDKNYDYSPANILGTGQIGLVTRIWDKVARLMNLNGFKFEISESRYTQPKEPKGEAIDDTILDLAVYSIIWMIHARGDWGK